MTTNSLTPRVPLGEDAARHRWRAALGWTFGAVVFFAVFMALGLWASASVQALCAMLTLGLIVGSFVNVVVLRLPRMLERQWQDAAHEVLAEHRANSLAVPMQASSGPRLSLTSPRAHCGACKAPVAARHSVPVVSYIVLRGRCAACRASFSSRYAWVELACGLLWAAVGWRFGMAVETVLYGVFLTGLLALSLIDWDTQLLPDSITLPLLWMGLLSSLGGWTVALTDAVLGAAAGYGVMWVIAAAFRTATGRDGMGQGDLKLMAALGAWLGWMHVPLVLTLGALVSAVVGGLRLYRRQLGWDTPQAFGPYLAAAGALSLFYGSQCLAYYAALLE